MYPVPGDCSVHVPAEAFRPLFRTEPEKRAGMVVHGGTPLKGTELSSYGDHRIAMSFLVAGLSAQGETVVTDAECINTSYPGFERDLAQFL